MAERSVKVWRVDLEASPPWDGELRAVLDEDELARADRFLHDSPRDEFLRSHFALRRVLASQLGASPESLRFAATEKGKPYLTDPEQRDVDFNLSHSHGTALIGVSTGGRIGVDVERRDVRNELEIARRWFAPDEVRWLEGLDGSVRQRRFLECWTRKEAYLKAVAIGIAGGIERCVCTLGPDDELYCKIVDDEHSWRLISLDRPDSPACAFVDFEPDQVEVEDFDWASAAKRLE